MLLVRICVHIAYLILYCWYWVWQEHNLHHYWTVSQPHVTSPDNAANNWQTRMQRIARHANCRYYDYGYIRGYILWILWTPAYLVRSRMHQAATGRYSYSYLRLWWFPTTWIFCAWLWKCPASCGYRNGCQERQMFAARPAFVCIAGQWFIARISFAYSILRVMQRQFSASCYHNCRYVALGMRA